MLTLTRRIHHAAIVSALACALLATAATASAVPTFATVREAHATTPAQAKLSTSERAYLRGIASLDYEQIAAAYNPAWRGEPLSATVCSSEADRLRAVERTRHALVDAGTATARKLIVPDVQLINPGGGESSCDNCMDAVETPPRFATR